MVIPIQSFKRNLSGSKSSWVNVKSETSKAVFNVYLVDFKKDKRYTHFSFLVDFIASLLLNERVGLHKILICGCKEREVKHQHMLLL